MTTYGRGTNDGGTNDGGTNDRCDTSDKEPTC
jgi:hypothetical protein